MGSKIIFSCLAIILAVVSGIVLLCSVMPRVVLAIALGVALVLLALLFRSVIKPVQTVVKGMELIKAQDFNNRLRAVGEHESDKIVAMFNQMIDKLRNERLHNREQDGFLKLLIDASPMGVVMLDFNGNIVLVNSSFLKITGLHDTETITGRKVSDLESGLARKMEKVKLGENKVIRHGDMRSYRCYHLSFLQTGFQRQFYLLESLTEELMRAERAAYEKVIRIISHEVNNTIGGVRSVLETVNDFNEDEDLREVIDSCMDRCDSMCGFISSYADVVRVPVPVLTETDLEAQLHKMRPFLQEMAGNVRVGLSVGDGEQHFVKVDMSLLQQVIVNIVKNAVESMEGKHGEIEIELMRNGREEEMVIANNGNPITEEESANLFSPFFTTKREGRGIGLTLISEILHRHDARFSLGTDPDGITRFRIFFRGAKYKG